MHITFVASSLVMGGIWRVIESLSAYLAGGGDYISTVTFYDTVFRPPHGDYYTLDHPRASRLSRIIALRSVLRKLRPDVVVAFGPMKSLYTLLVSPAPVIISLQRDIWTCPVNAVWELGWRALYSRAAAVVVLTSSSREYFMMPHIRVIPNPVTPLRVQGTAPQLPSNTILTVSRLSPEKGPDLLLRAFAMLNASAWHLAFAGNGAMRSALGLLAQKLRIADRVSFLGAVQDVYGCLSQAQIFALSSRSEGLGLALLEAMNWGLPVVSTACAGPVSIITQGRDGLLTPIAARCLADGLKQLISDSAMRARLALAAKKTAQRYRIETIGAQWRALIQEVA